MKNYNPFTLSGKTIIVTGASSGLGAQTSIDCSKMGAKVIMIGRNRERLNEIKNQTYNSKKQAIFSIDLTDYGKIDQFIKTDLKPFGPIHGIVHSAGISTTLPFKFSSPEKIENYIHTNVITGTELTRQIIKNNLLFSDGSSVIFLSSVMGFVGENAKTLYSITKGALISVTKSLAIEYASKLIRFNCISPAVVETPMSMKAAYSKDSESYEKIKILHPLGIGRASDISNSAIFLLSDASRWITGINLIVDGGYTAR